MIDNVVRNFARQPVKEGSLAMIARAENLRTETLQKMQAGKQRLEQRAAEGKAKSTLATTFQSKRDDGKARGLQPASRAPPPSGATCYSGSRTLAPRCGRPCEPRSNGCERFGNGKRQKLRPAAVADCGCSFVAELTLV